MMRYIFFVLSMFVLTSAYAKTYPVEQFHGIEYYRDIIDDYVTGTPEYGVADFTVTDVLNGLYEIIGTSTCHTGTDVGAMTSYLHNLTFGATETNTWCSCRILRPFVTRWFMPTQAAGNSGTALKYLNADHCLYSCAYDCVNSLITDGLPTWVVDDLFERSYGSEFYMQSVLQEPVINTRFTVARSSLGYVLRSGGCSNGGMPLASFNSNIPDAPVCRHEDGDKEVGTCFLYSGANTTNHTDDVGEFIHTDNCFYEVD